MLLLMMSGCSAWPAQADCIWLGSSRKQPFLAQRHLKLGLVVSGCTQDARSKCRVRVLEHTAR